MLNNEKGYQLFSFGLQHDAKYIQRSDLVVVVERFQNNGQLGLRWVSKSEFFKLKHCLDAPVVLDPGVINQTSLF